MTGVPAWSFFKIDEDSSGGGDLSRVLRANSDPADLLGREVLQNSWDASKKLARLIDDGDVPFKIEFRFVEIQGAEKAALVKEMGLEELRGQRDSADGQLSFVDDTILDRLTDESPLRLLYISDFGAHGLYGHPQELNRRSVMFRALYYMGGSNKRLLDEGAGGSYGFGKSAFIRGSRIRTVFAHSAFRPYVGEPNENDPVTRRLVGFCWWDGHDVGDDAFDGRAHLAKLINDSSQDGRSRRVPFEDDEADAKARSWGMPVRDPSDAAALGTTLLLLEPTVTAADLRTSLEYYWWPALEEGMDIRVIDEQGENLPIDAGRNAELRPFIEAYKIASGRRDARSEDNERLASSNWRARGKVQVPGALALLATRIEEPDDFVAGSDADDQVGDGSDGQARNARRSEVALVRSPRMVVQYLPMQTHRVPIKGVYIASPELDSLLSQTEPPTHDKWSTKAEDDIASEATDAALKVLTRIRKSVKDFAAEVAPLPKSSAVPLAHYAKLVARFLKSPKAGTKTPPAPPRPASPVEFTYSEPASPIAVHEQIATTAKIALRVASEFVEDQLLIAVSCKFRILEEESDSHGEDWPVVLRPALRGSGFVLDPDTGEWLGTITKSKAAEFEVMTDSYDPTWTGQLAPTVRPVLESDV